jgi:hypothetical protein
VHKGDDLTTFIVLKVKKIWSLNLPGKLYLVYPITGLNRPLEVQEVEAFRMSIHVAHEGGKVVRPKHRLPLPPTIEDLWY